MRIYQYIISLSLLILSACGGSDQPNEIFSPGSGTGGSTISADITYTGETTFTIKEDQTASVVLSVSGTEQITSYTTSFKSLNSDNDVKLLNNGTYSFVIAAKEILVNENAVLHVTINTASHSVGVDMIVTLIPINDPPMFYFKDNNISVDEGKSVTIPIDITDSDDDPSTTILTYSVSNNSNPKIFDVVVEDFQLILTALATYDQLQIQVIVTATDMHGAHTTGSIAVYNNGNDASPTIVTTDNIVVFTGQDELTIQYSCDDDVELSSCSLIYDHDKVVLSSSTNVEPDDETEPYTLYNFKSLGTGFNDVGVMYVEAVDSLNQKTRSTIVTVEGDISKSVEPSLFNYDDTPIPNTRFPDLLSIDYVNRTWNYTPLVTPSQSSKPGVQQSSAGFNLYTDKVLIQQIFDRLAGTTNGKCYKSADHSNGSWEPMMIYEFNINQYIAAGFTAVGWAPKNKHGLNNDTYVYIVVARDYLVKNGRLVHPIITPPVTMILPQSRHILNRFNQTNQHTNIEGCATLDGNWQTFTKRFGLSSAHMTVDRLRPYGQLSRNKLRTPNGTLVTLPTNIGMDILPAVPRTTCSVSAVNLWDVKIFGSSNLIRLANKYYVGRNSSNRICRGEEIGLPLPAGYPSWLASDILRELITNPYLREVFQIPSLSLIPKGDGIWDVIVKHQDAIITVTVVVGVGVAYSTGAGEVVTAALLAASSINAGYDHTLAIEFTRADISDGEYIQRINNYMHDFNDGEEFVDIVINGFSITVEKPASGWTAFDIQSTLTNVTSIQQLNFSPNSTGIISSSTVQYDIVNHSLIGDMETTKNIDKVNVFINYIKAAVFSGSSSTFSMPGMSIPANTSNPIIIQVIFDDASVDYRIVPITNTDGDVNPFVTASPNNVTAISTNIGLTTTLHISSDVPAVSIKWYINNEYQVNNTDTFDFTPSAVGNYSVNAIVGFNNTVVSVDWIVSVGDVVHESATMECSPNGVAFRVPTNGAVHLSCNGVADYSFLSKIELRDQNGEYVHALICPSGCTEIPFEYLFTMPDVLNWSVTATLYNTNDAIIATKVFDFHNESYDPVVTIERVTPPSSVYTFSTPHTQEFYGIFHVINNTNELSADTLIDGVVVSSVACNSTTYCAVNTSVYVDATVSSVVGRLRIGGVISGIMGWNVTYDPTVRVLINLNSPDGTIGNTATIGDTRYVRYTATTENTTIEDTYCRITTPSGTTYDTTHINIGDVMIINTCTVGFSEVGEYKIRIRVHPATGSIRSLDVYYDVN